MCGPRRVHVDEHARTVTLLLQPVDILSDLQAPSILTVPRNVSSLSCRIVDKRPGHAIVALLICFWEAAV